MNIMSTICYLMVRRHRLYAPSEIDLQWYAIVQAVDPHSPRHSNVGHIIGLPSSTHVTLIVHCHLDPLTRTAFIHLIVLVASSIEIFIVLHHHVQLGMPVNCPHTIAVQPGQVASQSCSTPRWLPLPLPQLRTLQMPWLGMSRPSLSAKPSGGQILPHSTTFSCCSALGAHRGPMLSLPDLSLLSTQDRFDPQQENIIRAMFRLQKISTR